jgi:uncharacterized protein (UPF0332 family)
MDEVEEQRRWETAQEFYQAATTVLNHQQYRACVGLAYYACFQAMWVALSDPPTGRWQHVGISRRFCHGQWTAPPLAPTQLAGIYRRLMALYELRLDAQYRALAVPLEQAQNGVQTALEVIQHVRQYKFGEAS